MHTAVANGHTEPARQAPQTSRRRRLEEHTELRRLLALGIVQALAVVDHRSATSAALRAQVQLIDQLFTRQVAQHIAEDDVHARQRAELHALGAWPADGDVELAARFDRLARDLLRDMAREERAFLREEGPSQGAG